MRGRSCMSFSVAFSTPFPVRFHGDSFQARTFLLRCGWRTEFDALFEFLFWKVEHHLWPAMSFVHLREASQILKSACKEFLGTEHRQS